ncbi:hypothetical protein L950_0229310 [Sphingobacterium sp. IITKGP-BTPF85]|nr:hypothetical protein L950_0229310 [Sphingobacterium sp. IITKGP-BTPF85]
MRNDEAEALYKGVVPLSAKRLFRPGEDLSFARPNFNKNGNGAPFPKIY